MLLLLLIHRPETVSISACTLYFLVLVAEALICIHDLKGFTTTTCLCAISAVFAFLGAVVTLNMPFRDPSLPDSEISAVLSTSTSTLRTPEDNLTLWQFMCVSWMWPLMSTGKTRQINDEDVWLLGYEFQHANLHEKFSQLPGSVLGRIVKANGIDLFLTGMYGIIELLANLSVPLLLQQLLRTLEDKEAPRRAAVVYATLSMIARVIAAQSDVLSLWFSRRSYERCRGELITMLSEKSLTRKMVGQTNDSKKGTDEESASMGKIMNLIRFDAYEVAQRFWEFQGLVTLPLNAILSTILIWHVIGWSALIGVIVVIVAQVINTLIAKLLVKWETIRRKATDDKLQKITQFIENIRHLRWYGWQNVWLRQIIESRQKELNLRIVTGALGVLIGFFNVFCTGAFPVAAFYAYTVWAGQPLRVDVAFPALALFSNLETSLREVPNVIRMLLNANVALKRIQTFMHEPDREEVPYAPMSGQNAIQMVNASFAWPGSTEPVLKDISLNISPGLTLIYGEVAAGKTALLQAIIGELDHLSGDFQRPSDTVGYCSQTPWLQSMSIRDNILFSSPFEPARYDEVLDACALKQDLVNFSDNDLSQVGENGTGLSGGQKARVALARAVYSHAPVLLLDDPLSSLDQQTAETIVRKCFAGPLVAGRTVVLATHRTDLCWHLARNVFEVSHGHMRMVEQSDSSMMTSLHKTKSNASAGGKEPGDPKISVAEPISFMEDEFRAHGGVKASVYWEYVRAGKYRWWIVLVVVLLAFRFTDLMQTWFLKAWGEAYDRPVLTEAMYHARVLLQETRHYSHLAVLSFPSFRDPLRNLPSPLVNIRPWLVGFLVLAILRAIIFTLVQGFMIVIIYCAGKRMFVDVMDRISSATFRYYDVTPVGRLMNRLTGDSSTIDGNISYQILDVARLILMWLFSVVVIAAVTPTFLVFSLVLTAAFIWIFLQFLPSSQSLRRLEMVSLSPLMTNFGQILYGMTTIRAFRAQKRFQDRVVAVTDTFQKMDHFYWTLQGWLMYRFDILSACSTLVLTLLAIYTGVSAGLTAFVLNAASKFVWATHMLCRTYGKLQMDFVSVERIIEMMHLEQEPPGEIVPPAAWPTMSGDIVFEDVTIRYAPHLDPALQNISLIVKAGSNTALLGRTGSGKSTLALALLATTTPENGRLLLDDVDLSKVDKHSLRQRITFLAQDPILFPGPLRANLDPLEAHTDEECSAVLAKIADPRYEWTLDTVIEPSGRNLSQGQRQLIGLARAVLRRSPVVIFDEATASIDLATSLRIQRILREEMVGCTVLTIAHRLEAVQDANYVVVLDKGRIVRSGLTSGGVVEAGEHS